MTLKPKRFHESPDGGDEAYLLNFGIQTLTSDPATTYPRMYYNSATHKFRVYEPNAAAWSDIGAGSAFITSVSDTGEVDLDVTSGVLTAAIVAIAAGKVTGFDAQVRTSRLDQMAAPTGSVGMNSQKITGLANGTSNGDAVNLGQLLAAINGLDWGHPSRRLATTTALPACTYANGTAGVGATLTANANGAFPATDGQTLGLNETILVKDQAAGLQNGPYKLTTVGSGGAPWVLTRVDDADDGTELNPGMASVIQEGTLNGDTVWIISNDTAITVGTTAIVFTQLPSPNALLAGAGLTRTGNQIDAVAGTTPGSGGPGGGLKANADDLVIDTDVVVRKYAATIGDGATADLVVTHNLNTRDVEVMVTDAATPWGVHDVYWEALTVNAVTIYFAAAPASNSLRAIVKA